MKKYGVARYDGHNMMDFGYINREEARALPADVQRMFAGIAWHEPPKGNGAAGWGGEHFVDSIGVYWCDREVDAHVLAGVLCKRNPGMTFIVFESKAMHVAAPGPVKKSVFTDKGIIPE